MTWYEVVQLVVTFLVGGIAAVAARKSTVVAKTLPLVVPQAPLVAQIERLPVTSEVVGGGHSGDVAATLLPWFPASYIPNWSQNRGVIPDGTQDAEHWNNCGETACSMVIAGVWGCPIEPPAIRQWLVGPAGSGLTDGAALKRALAHWSCKAHESVNTGEASFSEIMASLVSQRPVIALGHWEGPGTFLHWVVFVSNGNGVLQYCDPWQGARSFFTKSQFMELEAGQLVVLDSHVHFDCRTWPDPS